MALSVYLRANAAEKVVNSFSQRGEFDKMVAYASKVCVRVCVDVLAVTHWQAFNGPWSQDKLQSLWSAKASQEHVSKPT